MPEPKVEEEVELQRELRRFGCRYKLQDKRAMVSGGPSGFGRIHRGARPVSART